MEIKLIDYTHNPEDVIARAAAVCYDSEDGENANKKRLRKLLEYGHYSTLRQAYASFLIDGISRACSHQLVRVAHAGILQQSQRYKDITEYFPIIPADLWDLDDKELIAEAQKQLESSFKMYNRLVDGGMHREKARYWLPEATNTRLVFSGNFQMWQNWLGLRDTIFAQDEIREVAKEIRRLLREIAPNIF